MKCHNLRILSPLSCVFKKYSGPCKKLQNDKICLNGSANSSISDKFQNDKNFVVPPNGLGKRHIQVLILFWGYALSYSHKVNLSVGIVAMENNTDNPRFEQFAWDEYTRGVILSSLFWGYLITPIPAGIIAYRYGAKTPILCAALISSFATLLTPLAASFGWQYLCTARFIIGMMQGSIAPCVHTLLSKWVHPTERGFLSSVTYSGSKVGIVTTMATSGFIASSMFGWPGIFYVSGGVSLLWTIAWYIYGHNSPDDCPDISNDEREFIRSIPGTSNTDHRRIPWMDIMTSGPFLCLIVAHCGSSWGYFLLLTEIPSFIGGVLHFNIKSNALFSALPYFAMWFMLIILSRIADKMITKGYLTVIGGRKVFNSIGMWIPMACLMAIGKVGQNSFLAIMLLTMAVSFNAGIHVGFFINHMDLSPNYAGTLLGITSACGNVMSIIAPIFVGHIVTDKSDPALWHIVFMTSAFIYFIGSIVFIMFGSAAVQKWNQPEDTGSLYKII